MNVRFYSNFSKRKNSTKIPTGTYVSKTVRWKENTSIHNPVIELAGAPTPSYTYCYIQTWAKYYYVEDIITVANGVTEYHLKEDRLASHRSEINSCSTRVIYATNPYYSNKPDPRISVKTSRKITFRSFTNSTILDATGCYVLTVMNQTGTKIGVGTSYLLNQANMNIVADKLCDTTFSQALKNFFGGPLTDAVLSITWVPFAYSYDNNAMTTVTQVNIGDQTVSCDAYRLDKFYIKTSADSVDIHHTYPKTDFRCIQPYTNGSVFLPGIGVVDVSMSDLSESDSLGITIFREYITGNITYLLKNEYGDIIQSASCCVAAPCPLGQIVSNFGGVANGIKTAVAGAATLVAGAVGMGPMATLAGAGAMMTGAANTVLSYNQHAASISGNIGGRTVSMPNPVYVETSLDTEDPEDSSGYIAIKGRPLGEVVTLSSCTGFVQCDGAQVDIAGSEEERDEINALLNEGIYIE